MSLSELVHKSQLHTIITRNNSKSIARYSSKDNGNPTLYFTVKLESSLKL